MGVIIKSRTIRLSTREANSPYRINVINANLTDEIIIFIDHESKDFRTIYKCKGEVFKNSGSIYFKVDRVDDEISIKWSNGIELEKIK
ncbi:MAG: hypothetical protein ABJO28_11205 [Maribacter dokdonensis]|uniref:hypothetical protein n=1 Tax=Maribacter dokdonensis TaxID=320912 RepID=UPI003267D05C